MNYDLNGNIMRLKRSAELMTGNTAAFKIYNLRYDYTGNRLTKVTEEEIGKSEGYPYLASHNTIEYDNNQANGNGNMTKHLDKGISSIQYNFLNLPKQITQNAQVTNYTYRADGVKLKKLFGDIETNYMGGFQYKSTKPSEVNPGGDLVVINPNEVAVMKLRIIPTAEGYFDALSNQYIYNYKDHLGNVRLSYTDTNKDGVIQPRRFFVRECDGPWDPFNQPNCIDTWKPGEIVEVNNYYPFGLMHNYTATTQNAYQYKYNDKELQETGMYDYGARFYMPDIGRWGVIDPMAEKYRRWSPYNYAVNNPIMFIDPDGRDVTFSGAAAISIGKSLQAEARADNAANAGKTNEISFFSETGDENESSLSSWMQMNIGGSYFYDVHIGGNGKVSKTTGDSKNYHRFFDNKGKQLFFNDPDGVNKNFIYKKYNDGDYVYNPISIDAMFGAINSVPSNKTIKFLRITSGTGALYGKVAKESMRADRADFSAGFLSKSIGEDGKLVYENNSSYNIRFGDTNRIFSLMDAGNAMWGLWMHSLGFPNHEIKAGSHTYEFIRSFGKETDSPADQRAVFYFVK